MKIIFSLGSLPVTSVSSVNFESVSSYIDQMYHSLRGIDKVNPLMLYISL